MIILDYTKKNHKTIIRAASQALKDGKSVAYPTDTSYGLAVDATNIGAIKKLYKIKQRESKKPIHVIVPSVAYAKKIVRWNPRASKLAKRFWPRLRQGFGHELARAKPEHHALGQAGPLTLVLPLKNKNMAFKILSAGTGFLGIRYPNNKIALDLCKALGNPITTTSANPPTKKGWDDSYSARAIINQFAKYKYKPDIIINAGKLPKRKPSTMVKIVNNKIEILRKGPISEKEILEALSV